MSARVPGEEAFEFKDLVEQIPALIYVDVADSGEVLYISPYVQTMLGVTQEEWMNFDGDPWEAHLHPADRKQVLEQLKSYVAGGDDLDAYRMLAEDGRVVWVHDHAILHTDAHGRTIEQGVMVDITEAKLAEEALAFQAQLLQSISDAVIAYDTHMIVTSWNRAAQTLYGWTAEDIVGQPIPEALRYDPSELNQGDLWDPFIAEMQGWIGRLTQHDRDGYAIQVETKGMPLLATDGSVRGYVTVNREIAEL